MATTEVTYTQTGDSNKDFTVTFPFQKIGDIYVELGGVTQTSPTHYTLAGTTITFQNSVLDSGSNTIRLYRNTNIDKLQATFQTGSSIRAQDLNDNAEQLLYSLQERTAASTATPAATGLALTAGSKNHVTVNSASDWIISGTGIINAAMMAADSVDSSELVNGSVDLAHMSANSVDSDQYVDSSIDLAHMSANSVDSGQYVDGSIDLEHLASTTLASISSTYSNPVGTVIWYAGSTAPAGYLKANGDTIANGSGTTQSITADFSALYAVVGATLPDLRGEFVRGFDDGKGTDSGRAIRSTQADAFDEHTHSASTNTTSTLSGTANKIGEPFGTQGSTTGIFGGPETGYSSSNTPSSVDSTEAGQLTIDANHSHTVTVTAAGGSETRPRNIALLACIKY